MCKLTLVAKQPRSLLKCTGLHYPDTQDMEVAIISVDYKQTTAMPSHPARSFPGRAYTIESLSYFLLTLRSQQVEDWTQTKMGDADTVCFILAVWVSKD